jgi:hypothetical protein
MHLSIDLLSIHHHIIHGIVLVCGPSIVTWEEDRLDFFNDTIDFDAICSKFINQYCDASNNDCNDNDDGGGDRDN